MFSPNLIQHIALIISPEFTWQENFICSKTKFPENTKLTFPAKVNFTLQHLFNPQSKPDFFTCKLNTSLLWNKCAKNDIHHFQQKKKPYYIRAHKTLKTEGLFSHFWHLCHVEDLAIQPLSSVLLRTELLPSKTPKLRLNHGNIYES